MITAEKVCFYLSEYSPESSESRLLPDFLEKFLTGLKNQAETGLLLESIRIDGEKIAKQYGNQCSELQQQHRDKPTSGQSNSQIWVAYASSQEPGPCRFYHHDWQDADLDTSVEFHLREDLMPYLPSIVDISFQWRGKEWLIIPDDDTYWDFILQVFPKHSPKPIQQISFWDEAFNDLLDGSGFPDNTAEMAEKMSRIVT